MTALAFFLLVVDALASAWFCVSKVEGMKVVEIEKCRNDIKKLREEMVSRNNRCVRNNNKTTTS